MADKPASGPTSNTAPNTASNTANLQGATQITLDQLISSTSQSVLRALEEHQSLQKQPQLINPKIWVGYWIEYQHIAEVGQPAKPTVGGISSGGGPQSQ